MIRLSAALLMLAAVTLLIPPRIPRLGVSRRSAGAARLLRRRLRGRPNRAGTLADLPLALDLLACALRAGQPPSTAAAAVSAAVGGPVGAALREVARAAELGAPPEAAWQPLGQLTGDESVTRSCARATESGTRLADELTDLAADQRMLRASAAQVRVRRAGVLVVLPLGLCFLPAFVLIGVAPVVLGIAGNVLR